MNIEWSWYKQDEKYIISCLTLPIVSIAFSLKDAKEIFRNKLNKYFGHDKYKLNNF